MARMTGLDCAVIKEYKTYTHTHTQTHTHFLSLSNLEDAAPHTVKYLADAVERKKNKYRGSFPATYSLLPLAMSTCVVRSSQTCTPSSRSSPSNGSEHRLEIHSN